MKHCLPLVTAVLFAFPLIGLGKEPAPKTANRPAVPEWHDRYGMPWELEPSETPFQDNEIRECFLAADRLAREAAKENWDKRAGAKYPYLYWNAGSSGYNRRYQAAWEKGTPPDATMAPMVHRICIATDLYNKPRLAYGFEMSAQCQPKDSWTAYIRYYASKGINGTIQAFELRFSHTTLLPPSTTPTFPSMLRVGPGEPSYWADRRDDKYSYEFLALTRKRTPGGGLIPPKSAEISRYWESPEEFRQAVIDDFSSLEVACRDRFHVQVKTHGGPTGADPPMEVGGVEVPKSIKDEVIKKALDEISQQESLVNEHYKEMYAALVTAFPKFPEVLLKSVDDK